ncbi:MAG: Wzz/FepE/Etk N-terminal domain-containing protein [Candidatus Endonucleobacter bathymodioli]|uniref:Wzz/FepE/Etk N-terminal domain-containing protein n=1 Tax=Candidatus Endonucleibacter bathymodioli TaxID=539814 RepID=A0AA90NTE3_9GAMM|nr:Wzz/FepE/Etk N-terminal domain-containing protein [Candidatus Endonucleobacter bathymodioli]
MKRATPLSSEKTTLYQQSKQDDGIDVRELFGVIWAYKWFTVLMCAVAIGGTVFYASNAQEWWKAEVGVIRPQLNDVVTLYTKSKEVMGVLNSFPDFSSKSSKSGEAIMQELSNICESDMLLLYFVDAFNSFSNKKLFLESSSEFLFWLKANAIIMPTNELAGVNLEVLSLYRHKLNEWTKTISAQLIPGTSNFRLEFRANTKQNSAVMLEAYINHVNKLVKVSQYEKLVVLLDLSRNEFIMSINMAKQKAEKKLALMLEKTEYSYQMAVAAGKRGYSASFNPVVEMFPVHYGSEILAAEVKVLKDIRNLSIIDPEIEEQQIILGGLNNIIFERDDYFTSYHYLENIEEPLSREGTTLVLRTILATLLAGMLSVCIALLHHSLTKKEDE